MFIQKIFEVNKKQIFLVKKWEIQVIIFMIMLTRSSERFLIQYDILVITIPMF